MRLIVLVVALSASVWGLACTTFGMFRNDELFIGKSFQWPNSSGYVVINKRNLEKTSLKLKPSDKAVSWVSRYGSLTLNQHGAEFPLSGVNEAGLVVEIMWGGHYDAAPDSRLSLNELQWIQFQLDNFSTVDEVVQNLDENRWSRVFGFVHYLVCDKTARCAAIEPFYGDKPLVTLSNEMPVPTLANNTYPESAAFLEKHLGFGGTLPIPQAGDSLSRFVRASALTAKAINETEPLSINKVFEVLEKVTLGDWEVAYDLTKRLVAFRTVNERKTKLVDASRWDFSCKSPRQLFPMNDKSAEGDITDQFEDYTLETNKKMVASGAEGLSGIPTVVIQAFQNYPESTRCVE